MEVTRTAEMAAAVEMQRYKATCAGTGQTLVPEYFQTVKLQAGLEPYLTVSPSPATGGHWHSSGSAAMSLESVQTGS